MRTRLFQLALFVWCAAGASAQGIITTVAGTDLTYPGSSFSANSASFGQLSGIATHPITGDVYFASRTRSLIVKFNPAKNAVSIVAGIGIGGFSGDGGPATQAALNTPQQLTFDSAGNLYIADGGNGRIRKIDAQGVITTAVTGAGIAVAVGADGSIFTSSGIQIIRVSPDGSRAVIAGGAQPGYTGDGGPAVNALLNGPQAFALDPTGNLFFIDSNNRVVRRIGTNGIISTVAGNGQIGTPVAGPALASPLTVFPNGPAGLALDKSGNLFVATFSGGLVMIDSKGVLSILNSNFTGGTSVPLGKTVALADASISPSYLAFDAAGNLDFVDRIANVVYRTTPGGTVQLLVGYAPGFGLGDNGPAAAAGLNAPQGLGWLADGSLIIADTSNYRVRRVSPAGVIATILGNGALGNPVPGPALSVPIFPPFQAVSDLAGNVYVHVSPTLRIDPSGVVSVFTNLTAGGGGALALDAQGNLFASTDVQNVVRRISPEGNVAQFAGSGQRSFSGDGGPALSAGLNNPYGLAFCPDGNLYIADQFNNRIRRVDSNGIITTYAGGSGLPFKDGVPATQSTMSPRALACDRQGVLYLTDINRVRKITSDGVINTIAGTGQPGFGGDGGSATSALLNGPQGIAVDSAGNIFISDSNNNRIRKILATPPTFSVSNSHVTVSSVSQGPQTQANVAVSSSVQGLAYSIAFSTATGGDWLGVASLQGTAPGVLNITADPGALQPGAYQGTITLSSPYSNPASLSIAVTFNVGAAQPAALSLQTKALSFSFTSGSGPSSQQLSVSNQGAGTISFTALPATTNGGGCLSVSPLSGAVSNMAPANLNLTVTPGNLGAGTYSGSITIASSDTGESIVVPVTMSISAAQQKILLSQTGLTFIAVAQAGPPLPQSFGILNTGQGSMGWTATASTLSGGSGWLSIDQTSGTVARPYLDVSLVNVSIDTTGLAAGTYYGQIQVKAAGAANSPQSITVLLNVLPPGSNPGPELRPTGVIFIGTPGNSPGSQSVMVSNATAAALNYGSSSTYVAGGGWLQYLPANATVAPGQPVKLILQPDLSNLQPGIQRAAVTLLFADGSARTVSVLNVVAPGPGGGLSATGEAAGGCTTLLVHPTALTDATASVTVGQATALAVKIADNCGNLFTAGTVTAGFSNNDPPVNLVHIGGGNWSGTWTPRSASPSRVTIQFTALLGQAASQVLSGSVSVPVTVQAGAAAPLTSGVVNAASFVGTYIAPGGLVSIFGQQLADTAVASSNAPFPTQVNGTQVLMGGKPLPLRYVGSGQVNAQVPFDLGVNTQQQLVVVRGATLSVPQDVVVAAAQPAVYTQNLSGKGAGVIVDGITNQLNTPANPATAGDVVVIYANGLGAVNPQVPSGTPAPMNGPLSQTVNPLTVTIGGVNAHVNFAGLAPGYPDLYQVNVVVPAGATAGNAVPVVLSIAGQTSPVVTMAVR